RRLRRVLGFRGLRGRAPRRGLLRQLAGQALQRGRGLLLPQLRRGGVLALQRLARLVHRGPRLLQGLGGLPRREAGRPAGTLPLPPPQLLQRLLQLLLPLLARLPRGRLLGGLGRLGQLALRPRQVFRRLARRLGGFLRGRIVGLLRALGGQLVGQLAQGV